MAAGAAGPDRRRRDCKRPCFAQQRSALARSHNQASQSTLLATACSPLATRSAPSFWPAWRCPPTLSPTPESEEHFYTGNAGLRRSRHIVAPRSMARYIALPLGLRNCIDSLTSHVVLCKKVLAAQTNPPTPAGGGCLATVVNTVQTSPPTRRGTVRHHHRSLLQGKPRSVTRF